MSSEKERERLKEEYKDHYRQLKDLKQKLYTVERRNKINEALNNMNIDVEKVKETYDEFMFKVREQVAKAEVKLDMALEKIGDLGSSDNEEDESSAQQEFEETLKSEKAKETIQQLKAEMGLLYSEIENSAAQLDTKKTIGKKKDNPSNTQ